MTSPNPLSSAPACSLNAAAFKASIKAHRLAILQVNERDRVEVRPARAQGFDCKVFREDKTMPPTELGEYSAGNFTEVMNLARSVVREYAGAPVVYC